MDKPMSNSHFRFMALGYKFRLKEDEIIARLTDKGLFRLSIKGKRVYNFFRA